MSACLKLIILNTASLMRIKFDSPLSYLVMPSCTVSHHTTAVHDVTKSLPVRLIKISVRALINACLFISYDGEVRETSYSWDNLRVICSVSWLSMLKMSKPGEKRAKKTQKTLFETFKKPMIFLIFLKHAIHANYGVSYWFQIVFKRVYQNVCIKIFKYL